MKHSPTGQQLLLFDFQLLHGVAVKDVDAGSPAAPAARTTPTVFVVSDSPAGPTTAAVLVDDAAMPTGDDDKEMESDSMGEEVDHSSVATGIGKHP